MPRVVLLLAVIAFTVYCLVDCLQAEDQRIRNLPKLLWTVIIVFFPVAGPGAWLIAGRPGTFLSGQPGPPAPPQRGPIGPDDDPDFLRGL